MQNYDLELALNSMTDQSVANLKSLVPSNYHVENKSHSGWGYTISLVESNFTGDFDKEISEFLSPLEPLDELISSSSSVLRVAIFNDKVTCTVKLLESLELLVSNKIGIEFTVYPVS